MDQSERILFIDDDAPVRTAFARSLRGHGFTIDLADGAAGAMEFVDKTTYAVIATDYRMPRVNGLELIEDMRITQPDATFLLVSGECDLDLALEAVNDHAVSYVVCKPWDTEELASVLKRSMEAFWERAGQRRMQQSMVSASRDMEEQKDRLRAALAEAEVNMAEMLVDALGMRGHETREHCQRVSAYALLLAQHMNLRGRVLDSIRQGALLHDVGKIAISDNIMLKPGPLNQEEWAVMKTHPRVGASLLDSFENLTEARKIVSQHHERWDGSGYPIGMKGKQICLGARIFAVADALDALMSERPYRKTMSVEEASAEVVRCNGTHFDPEVIEAFKKVEPGKWVEIRRRFPKRVRTAA